MPIEEIYRKQVISRDWDKIGVDKHAIIRCTYDPDGATYTLMVDVCLEHLALGYIEHQFIGPQDEFSWSTEARRESNGAHRYLIFFFGAVAVSCEVETDRKRSIEIGQSVTAALKAATRHFMAKGQARLDALKTTEAQRSSTQS